MKVGIQSQVKSAQNVFSRCPKCKAGNLIHCEHEAICPDCGWDTIALRVEASFSKTTISAQTAPSIRPVAYSIDPIEFDF